MSQAIERVLTAGGFAVLAFNSAEAFIRADVASNAGCLVLDVRLPGMSGFELYRQLGRQGDLAAPVIFITAHDEASTRAEAARAGAKGFLVKPFSGRMLLDAVKRAISTD